MNILFRRQMAIFFLSLIAPAVFFAFVFMSGYYWATVQWEREAIARGFAHYVPTNSPGYFRWEWKSATHSCVVEQGP